jgi:hypothetical protein
MQHYSHFDTFEDVIFISEDIEIRYIKNLIKNIDEDILYASNQHMTRNVTLSSLYEIKKMLIEKLLMRIGELNKMDMEKQQKDSHCSCEEKQLSKTTSFSKEKKEQNCSNEDEPNITC